MGKDMKRFIRCAECANAARKPSFGFAQGQSELYCTERSGTVDDDDGCTFGRPGSPRHAWIACEVDIGDDAAKRGW